MMGTLWDSINLALIVAYLVAVHVALHTSHNLTRQRLGNATTTPNAKPANKTYTTATTANKPNTYDKQPQSATYAAYRSNQATPLRQITLKQETQTHNYFQHTEDATLAGGPPPYQPPTHQPAGRQTTTN